jgi:hypothetical protein
LLSRDGSYFNLNKRDGSIEFGASANLVTQLLPTSSNTANKEEEDDSASSSSLELIQRWLMDDGGRGLAKSIWDEKLLTELSSSSSSSSSLTDDEKNNNNDNKKNGAPVLYRMQVMPLQFVTLRLSPSVDILMWTQPPGKNRAGNMLPPIFKIQSTAFEPNIQLMPGMPITAESLGISIEVVGDLRPTIDGMGVQGKISFTTKGILPGPLKIVPEGVIKVASDAINDTIVQFAIQSFQKGATTKFKEFQTSDQGKKDYVVAATAAASATSSAVAAAATANLAITTTTTTTPE